jgi:hypothetical protein
MTSNDRRFTLEFYVEPDTGSHRSQRLKRPDDGVVLIGY